MKNYSVNNIADCVKVSAPTVRHRIEELGIKNIAKRGKALLYSEEDSIKICASFEKSAEEFLEFFKSTENNEESEKKRKEEQTKVNKEEKNNKENAEGRDSAGLSGVELIDFLYDEIKRKDKENDFLREQIDKKDELITSLNNKNDFLMAKQMGLSLEDFRARAEAESVDVNTTEKKEGFFKKLFKARKD